MLTTGADPVRKVSIIPRGQALGVTFSAPDSDRFNYAASGSFAAAAFSATPPAP
jgi:ATP-dependent Zn protease